jgi:hypothetical protein
VGPYFLAVSEQLQKHGPGRVHFTRLSSEYKRGASATFQGVLLASIRRVIRQPEPPPLMAEPINPRMVNRIARYLKSGGVPEDIRLTGLQHVMAR